MKNGGDVEKTEGEEEYRRRRETRSLTILKPFERQIKGKKKR